MPGRLVTLSFVAGCFIPYQSPATPLAAGLVTCREVISDVERLTCYDRLADTGQGEQFNGQGSGITPTFEVAAPRLMTFESEDAVMVVYLLNAQDEVVQNLHRGGAGGGSFLIETPGQYHVQVNATGRWTIRVARAN